MKMTKAGTLTITDDEIKTNGFCWDGEGGPVDYGEMWIRVIQWANDKLIEKTKLGLQFTLTVETK